MPTVELLPGEPIIVSTHDTTMTLEDVQYTRGEIARLLESFSGPYVLVIDVSRSQVSFGDYLKILQATGRGRDNTISNQRTLLTILVGSGSFVSNFRSAMQQQNNNTSIAAFPTLQEALQTARIQLRMQQPGS